MPRVISLITTASAAEVPVNSTTYNEQTSGAQRSLKSASANDAAAGSGARTVRVIYYKLAADGTIRGPFSEVVTLNGQTAVPMVATDLALVERIELVTAGSGGVPAGAITLYAAADGTGTAIAQIASGQPRTWLGHHYVASGKRCQVTDLECFGGDAGVALLRIVREGYPTGAVEQPVTGQYGTTNALPRGVQFNDAPHTCIPGPARVRLLVTPGNTDSQITRASFGFIDEGVGVQ